MFVVMAATASEAEILGVKSHILAEGLTPYDHTGPERIGHRRRRRDRRSPTPSSSRRSRPCPASSASPRSARPFKLTSREFHPEDTVIRVADAVIGDGSLTMMAGPCSVESRDQLFETADAVAAAGATILRGGAFKPRTSPYSFQGLGVEALRYLAEARERTGPAGHHRGDGAQPGRHRRRVRRHPADRHAEHAELLAPRRPSGGSPGR